MIGGLRKRVKALEDARESERVTTSVMYSDIRLLADRLQSLEDHLNLVYEGKPAEAPRHRPAPMKGAPEAPATD